MNIPFLDLKAQYAQIKTEIDAAVSAVFEKCDFVGGDAISAFEKDYAEFCQTKHCAGVSCGTDAIYLTLEALGVGLGDEVITTANTFIGTTMPISRTGASIKFVDINPKTLNIDVSQIERTITHRTKAIIPVHLFGQPAEMDYILKIARAHDLLVIEDAAQAHGAKYKGRTVGSLGHAGVFSFYPAKNLGASGDAGGIVTNDSEMDKRIRLMRDCGRSSKTEHSEEGPNHRMDTIQAAVLHVKLKHLDEWNAARRRIAGRYESLFSDHEQIQTVYEPEGVEGVYHLFVVQVKNRDKVKEKLAEVGVPTAVHYPIPLHLQPAYRRLEHEKGDFPVTEAVCERCLSLPIYPEMTDEMVDYVAKNLIKAVR